MPKLPNAPAQSALCLASIAVVVEGGVVQDILTRDRALASTIIVIDLDVDDEDVNATLTGPDGRPRSALIRVERPTQANIKLAFNNRLEDQL